MTTERELNVADSCGCEEACVVPAPSAEDVCSLPPEELDARREMLRREIWPRIVATHVLPGGRAFEFARTPEMRAKLEDLVAFERQCCSTLTWTLEDRREADRLRLTVEGIDPQAPFFHGIRPPDSPAAAPARGGLGRLAKAGGFGAGAALLLCCGLPIGIAAVAGAAAAAPFLVLDNPPVIVPVALLTGGAAWYVMKRRAARAVAPDCGC